MKLEPLPNFVVVELLGTLDEDGPAYGKIVATNPCGMLTKDGDCIVIGIEPGDTVVFAKYGGVTVGSLVILPVRDILARVVEEEEE